MHYFNHDSMTNYYFISLGRTIENQKYKHFRPWRLQMRCLEFDRQWRRMDSQALC